MDRPENNGSPKIDQKGVKLKFGLFFQGFIRFPPAYNLAFRLFQGPASSRAATRGSVKVVSRCHRSLQNQPVGVKSKPATLRCLIRIKFLDAGNGFLVSFGDNSNGGARATC
jgi:hypothetical protein